MAETRDAKTKTRHTRESHIEFVHDSRPRPAKVQIKTGLDHNTEMHCLKEHQKLSVFSLHFTSLGKHQYGIDFEKKCGKRMISFLGKMQGLQISSL